MTDSILKAAAGALRAGKRGVLALPAGGCTRYIFSTDVDYTLNAAGEPVFVYDSANPYHHDLLTRSTMSLRVDLERNPDGSEKSHVVLVGDMVPVSDTDKSKKDYRLKVDRALIVLETGETRTLDWPAIAGYLTKTM